MELLLMPPSHINSSPKTIPKKCSCATLKLLIHPTMPRENTLKSSCTLTNSRTSQSFKDSEMSSEYTELKLENSLESLNVLVIMNPIGEVLCRDFLQIINDATKEIKVNLSIKLHPSSEHYGHLPKLIFNNYPYKVFRLENTHDLIRKSDVVISTTSTVGAETIALYKPLIQIKLEEINTKLAYEDYDCCISVRNHIELLEILKDKKQLYS